MSKTIWAAAVAGIVAGASGCAEPARPRIPGAPTADPEGAVVAGAPSAAEAPPQKMACSAAMMGKPPDATPAPNPTAAPSLTPAPPPPR